MNECYAGHITFESFTSVYFTAWLPFDVTDGNVSAADQEWDGNVNETDYMLKRDMSGK